MSEVNKDAETWREIANHEIKNSEKCLAELNAEKELNKKLKEALEKISAGIDTLGCGDSGCATRRASGMCTNAGCRCYDKHDPRRLVGGISRLRSIATDAIRQYKKE